LSNDLCLAADLAINRRRFFEELRLDAAKLPRSRLVRLVLSCFYFSVNHIPASCLSGPQVAVRHPVFVEKPSPRRRYRCPKKCEDHLRKVRDSLVVSRPCVLPLPSRTDFPFSHSHSVVMLGLGLPCRYVRLPSWSFFDSCPCAISRVVCS
jgi:hypothetical protein